MVAIARALYIASAKILILDEPTSSLDVNETEQLFKVMRKLKSEGVGHYLHHPFHWARFMKFQTGSRSCERETGRDV
jgi:ABC-type sugar transport system ATPase subunit